MTISFTWGVDLKQMFTGFEFAYAPIDCLGSNTKVSLDLLGRFWLLAKFKQGFLSFVVSHSERGVRDFRFNLSEAFRSFGFL